MKKSAPQPIGEVLKAVVEKLSASKNKDCAKILSCWLAIAGRRLTQHSRPASLKQGRLQVLVDDSAWFYQASLEKERLLLALQKKIGKGKVQDIQFRIAQKAK